ncbi:MAG: apolipoprotein N-acyltransferase [Eubacteriales bacterium]
MKLDSFIRPEKKWLQFIYLTVSGIISGVCMAFPSMTGAVIEWIAFIPAALVVFTAAQQKIKLSRAYWGGFWLVYSQHIIVYHWFISFYPLDFTELSKPAAAGVVFLAIFGISFLAAMFGGVFGMMTVGIAKLKTAHKHPLLVPLAAASAYVLNEWIRTMFWFGVPWGRLALGQLTDGKPISVLSASLFGSYFIAFLIVLVAFLPAQALFLKKFKLRPALAALLVVANLITGAVIANVTLNEKTTVKVAAIQGNINSRDKWYGMTDREKFELYLDLTVCAAEEGAQLIVWPETTLSDDSYFENLAEFCREYGINVVFGAFDKNDEGDYRNTLKLIDHSGEISETVYVKRHLVPFGEYVPMRDLFTILFPPLAQISMLESDLAAGDGSELFKIEINGNSVNLGGLICFDSIYEELSYSSANDGAEILCIGTNDSWFLDSRAVYMHCAQSRLRAIETGLPVVRAGNTGISAVITQKGEVLRELDPLVKGYIVSDICVDSDESNSYFANEVFLWLCVLYLGAIPAAELAVYLSKKRK